MSFLREYHGSRNKCYLIIWDYFFNFNRRDDCQTQFRKHWWPLGSGSPSWRLVYAGFRISQGEQQTKWIWVLIAVSAHHHKLFFSSGCVYRWPCFFLHLVVFMLVFSKTIYLSVLIATLCSYVCSYAFLSLTQIHFIEKMMLKTILTGDRTSRSSSNLPFLSHLSWIHHECLWIFTCSCVQHNAFVVLAWTVSRLYIVLFKSQDFGFVFVITKRSCKA